MHQNDLDIDLVKSVGDYFQMNNTDMEIIINEVKTVVKNWPTVAKEIGISRGEQEMMSGAFRF